jgi:hypothetical protein
MDRRGDPWIDVRSPWWGTLVDVEQERRRIYEHERAEAAARIHRAARRKRAWWRRVMEWLGAN